jgi:hypothetical protein
MTRTIEIPMKNQAFSTRTISAAMYQLADEMHSDNQACHQAATRLNELHIALLAIKDATSKGEMRRIAMQASGSTRLC